MIIVLAVLAVFLLALAVFALIKNKQLENDALRIQKEALASVAEAQQESERKCQHFESETQRVYSEAQAAVAEAQKQLDQQFAEVRQESDRIRQHYEAEARKSQEAAEALLAKALKELEPLRKYESLQNAEEEMKRTLASALTEATALRNEAQTLLEETRRVTIDERVQATQKVKDLREQADVMLNQAIRDAGRIVSEAEKRAAQMAGDAYTALRDKQLLEQAAAAMRNVIEGYGDRYVVPTHSLLDDLAVEFGYDAAGLSLKSARDPQERIDELGHAGVPFEFDIHALIESENAPALEHKIHKQLLAMQVNKMNFRKEFFRVTLADIHQEIGKLKQGEDFVIKTWTEKAIAQEYKDSIEIEGDPQKKEKWLARQRAMTDRQLKFDLMRLSLPEADDTDGDNESN